MGAVTLFGSSSVEIVYTLKNSTKIHQTKSLAISRVYTQLSKLPEKSIYIRAYNEDPSSVTLVEGLLDTAPPTAFVRIYMENDSVRVFHPDSIVHTNFGKLSTRDLVTTMEKKDSPTMLIKSHGLPEPRAIPERWKYIKGFPKYEVSTDGRIRYTTTNHGKILKSVDKVARSSDRMVSVHTCDPNCTKTFILRDLVLETFVGRDSSISHSRYINGNKKDNRLSNLQWVLKEEVGPTNHLLPPSVSVYKKVVSADRVLNLKEECYTLTANSSAIYVDTLLTDVL